jgi:hypothetical protein
MSFKPVSVGSLMPFPSRHGYTLLTSFWVRVAGDNSVESLVRHRLQVRSIGEEELHF